MSPISLYFQISSGKPETQMCSYKLEPEPSEEASSAPWPALAVIRGRGWDGSSVRDCPGGWSFLWMNPRERGIGFLYGSATASDVWAKEETKGTQFGGCAGGGEYLTGPLCGAQP